MCLIKRPNAVNIYTTVYVFKLFDTCFAFCCETIYLYFSSPVIGIIDSITVATIYNFLLVLNYCYCKPVDVVKNVL